jgi:hypothetical protein
MLGKQLAKRASKQIPVYLEVRKIIENNLKVDSLFVFSDSFFSKSEGLIRVIPWLYRLLLHLIEPPACFDIFCSP